MTVVVDTPGQPPHGPRIPPEPRRGQPRQEAERERAEEVPQEGLLDGREAVAAAAPDDEGRVVAAEGFVDGPGRRCCGVDRPCGYALGAGYVVGVLPGRVGG